MAAKPTRGECTLKYYLRIDPPGKNVMYGPVDVTYTAEEQNSIEVSMYQHCASQTSSSSSFAMQNKVEVSGVIKVFDLSLSHAHQYEKSNAEAQQEDKGYSINKKAAKSASKEVFWSVEKGEVLLNYCEVTVIAFDTGNGPQHVHFVSSGGLKVRGQDRAPKNGQRNIPFGQGLLGRDCGAVGRQDIRDQRGAIGTQSYAHRGF